jgi:hypothetical protein
MIYSLAPWHFTGPSAQLHFSLFYLSACAQSSSHHFLGQSAPHRKSLVMWKEIAGHSISRFDRRVPHWLCVCLTFLYDRLALTRYLVKQITSFRIASYRYPGSIKKNYGLALTTFLHRILQWLVIVSVVICSLLIIPLLRTRAF